MSDVDHERLSELYLEALELPADRRDRFLDDACAGEPEMRAELEGMLAHGRSPAGVLQTGAIADRMARPAEELPESVGPYRIVRVIGEGGMGVVALAEQQAPVRREVAIKLIKAGIETREVLARFDTERQAMALMSHPNVARVLDAGIAESGRSYFVMDYIEGETITRYCDRERLGIRRRLELFVEICEGIQHAHQKGVIHRDIKPSNVLVSTASGRAVPKIIDFGIAKALDRRLTDRTLMTVSGQMIGTPEYMSPEQATGDGQDVDTRTDVYSLGLLLLELLSGSRPFSWDKKPDTEREVPRPSGLARLDPEGFGQHASRMGLDAARLTRDLRGDLEWIVLQATARDRDRRYASPGELAADVQRFLRHEPIVARPPSTLYLARRFVRRHRAAVAVAAGLLVILVGFSIATTVQARHIARERNRAIELADYLTQMLALDDPLETEGRPFSQTLDQAATEIEQALPNEPLYRARLMATIARANYRLSAEVEVHLWERALALIRDLRPEDDLERLTFLDGLAKAYQLNGREAEAVPLFEQALELRRSLLGPDHEDTLRIQVELGNAYRRHGTPEQSLDMLDDALSRARRALGEDHTTSIRAGLWHAAALSLNGATDDSFANMVEMQPVVHRNLALTHPLRRAYSQSLACEAAKRGELETAVPALREALEGGYDWHWLRDTECLHRLMPDPRVTAMLGGGGYIKSLRLARDFMSAGYPREAMYHLSHAVDGGFANREALEQDEWLHYLLEEPGIEDLLARIP